MTSNLPIIHERFLRLVCQCAEEDERINALLIGGSYVHGGLDEQSDLDFVLVVESERYEEMMETRRAFAEKLPNFLNAFTGEHVGEPRLLICLFGPPLLHVDLKFVLMSDFDSQIEKRAILFAKDPLAIKARIDSVDPEWPNLPAQWFEDRAWIWLHYASTKYARGELYEAIGMLGFFREQVLGPLLYRRAGLDQRGVRRLESLGLDASESLTSTVPTYDAESVRNAITIALDMYVQLREDDPPAAPTQRMPELLLDFL